MLGVERMKNEKMTGFLNKQLVLLKFNLNCTQITNNSAFIHVSEQNGAKCPGPNPMWVKGFSDLVDRTKLFFNRFLRSKRKKIFFIFSFT